MFCCCFLFLTIPVRPISECTKPIFAKFSELIELWLWMITLVSFRSPKGRCYGNQCLLALSTQLTFGDIRQMAL